MIEKLIDATRRKLARLEDSIILGLFKRAEYRANLSAYVSGLLPVPSVFFLPDGTKIENFDGSFLDYMLFTTEAPHAIVGRYENPEELPFSRHLPKPLVRRKRKGNSVRILGINKNPEIIKRYIGALGKICIPGEDDDHGSATVCDVTCLHDISKRVHLGTHVAEAKFQDDPAGYQSLILTRNTRALTDKLRDPAVEQKVLERVKQKGERYGMNPEFIAEFFEKQLIPLTIDVEVEYFMRRNGRE